ncbi:hypothetical protein [Pseudoalteromonas luteoviolacea]|uniref:Uncharacterized protein n=1 Tax=Pseudoalteromonas luteoviolacea S4054 TaxID=1129367 RepID=A0A0F6AAC4_9GAMM|nr:hypothetical protein [Pseudoalteromonas luteoviolacea]AOT07838.1 hypothetical protein S4054249_08280 [Pseudoalteromonas luteoviolacea]AOT12754.1 hypothetical protein S40542_08280 [Pseudoalteromonas luteoviolacea]AOT17667.1 hypothetical protein S4054_08275 [Pseudoalteromonas luteoviolacea]KKE82329.1 hypothetical protein N479_19000 [Pseudoalteromonas luteoviolacea S4054]KZN78981.1 hypothetical protein N481_00630 [Pseudoalteromonas luteoviolacea S4047-1]
MFSYESLTSLLDYYGFIILPFYIFALIISWKNLNFRYLLLLLIGIEAFDSAMYFKAVSWGNVYYLWGFFMCTLFIVPVLTRRLIAEKLEPNIEFFRKAKKNYRFTRQEGGLLFLFYVTAITFLITFAEVNLYKLFLIDSYPFRLYIYEPTHILISVSELFLVFSMILDKKEIVNDSDNSLAHDKL